MIRNVAMHTGAAKPTASDREVVLDGAWADTVVRAAVQGLALGAGLDDTIEGLLGAASGLSARLGEVAATSGSQVSSQFAWLCRACVACHHLACGTNTSCPKSNLLLCAVSTCGAPIVRAAAAASEKDSNESRICLDLALMWVCTLRACLASTGREGGAYSVWDHDTITEVLRSVGSALRIDALAALRCPFAGSRADSRPDSLRMYVHWIDSILQLISGRFESYNVLRRLFAGLRPLEWTDTVTADRFADALVAESGRLQAALPQGENHSRGGTCTIAEIAIGEEGACHAAGAWTSHRSASVQLPKALASAIQESALCQDFDKVILSRGLCTAVHAIASKCAAIPAPPRSYLSRWCAQLSLHACAMLRSGSSPASEVHPRIVHDAERVEQSEPHAATAGPGVSPLMSGIVDSTCRNAIELAVNSTDPATKTAWEIVAGCMWAIRILREEPGQGCGDQQVSRCSSGGESICVAPGRQRGATELSTMLRAIMGRILDSSAQ